MQAEGELAKQQTKTISDEMQAGSQGIQQAERAIAQDRQARGRQHN
jgi:hypothetical protein